MSELKVEGLTKDWCATCAHCTGKKRHDGHTYYICEDPYDAAMTEHDAEEEIICNMFKKKDCTEGTYPFGNLADNLIKYSANDVIIIAKAMAEEEYGEKQKELENKVSAYEKVLIDILNEVYEHPEMFERNMTAYEFLPGRVKFLNDSWNMMCDKYDPLNVENEQRKKAMDNQAKMIQDLKKERDELAEKLKNADISKVPKLEAQIKNLEYLNEESYKREEELEKKLETLKSDIDCKDAQLAAIRLSKRKDDKRWNDLNNNFFLPLCSKLYGTTKINKTCEEILNDISELKDSTDRYIDDNKRMSKRNSELYQVNLNKSRDIINLEKEVKRLKECNDGLAKANDKLSELVNKVCHERNEIEKKLKRQECLNDMNAKTIADLVIEKKCLNDENEKLRFTLGEKTEDLHKLSDNYDEILDKHENLTKKNRELQIRVNDLLFQERLNKSAFGYDFEEENGKLRVENEQLRNMVKSQRNCSSSYYYSALKAEDKIEHIQKEAKKWKRKYKEAYDILETYFKYDIDGMEYDASCGELSLTLRYRTPNGDNSYKYEALRSAYERLRRMK